VTSLSCPARLVALFLYLCALQVYAVTSDNPASPGGGSEPASLSPSIASGNVVIPGPLRPFLRMAAISQKASPDEILPLLGRNVAVQGYYQGHPTEFLILLNRYVRQARELSSLAGADGVIRISDCADAAPLLAILGYRLRNECGRSDTSLETANPERAFVTVDSGFPLPQLEQTLAGGKPFTYAFPASGMPGIFDEAEWVNASKTSLRQGAKYLLDAMLRDPELARLYWALSRLDPDTRSVLRSELGIQKLLPHAAVLDFYGGRLYIRSGRVVVPGGSTAEPAWQKLVGASPESPGEFVHNLVSKDHGWLAAYFDVLSRARPERQAYFTDPSRISRFYQALLASGRSDPATRGVFRPAPQLLLLVTRLPLTGSGQPLVPGNLGVWKEILRQERKWGHRVSRISDTEGLIEAMFALSRVKTDVGPLQVYMTLSELANRRSPTNPLSPQLVRLLGQDFELFGSQYRLFTEFPDLSDDSISLFLKVARSLDGISAAALRGNALGTFQANLGLWQIFARQQQIPAAKLNDSWAAMLRPFIGMRTSAGLYDAGHASLRQLLRAAAGRSSLSQAEIVDLLAGPRQTVPEARRMHQELANRMLGILDSQRLVSLDTLLALGEALDEKAQGKPVSDSIIALAGELQEFQMPQPIFSRSERTEWAAGIYNNSHTDAEMRADVAKVLKSSASRAQLLEAKGQLALFLRDTLVALNYAYYEPPGAQMLRHNPLFVRSHDFAAETVGGIKGVWQVPQMFGEGSPAGGGAHLVGSLADLPYVLAELEQDFISPEYVQALIWREMVPSLLTSAIVPRWWGVSRDEMHAVALYQRAGEEILKAAAQSGEVRSMALDILFQRMSPLTLQSVAQSLDAGSVDDLIANILPADTFYLAVEFRRKFPQQAASFGPSSEELEALSRREPQAVAWDRLSQDFGVPHPVLAQTYSRELLDLAPIPAFERYASRLLAESWDSSNLYWARLLDEKGYSPVMLNRFAPELTRRMIEKITATNFEDWPALLRALHETGEEFRQGRLGTALAAGSNASFDPGSGRE
jgi:hypothetical protein